MSADQRNLYYQKQTADLINSRAKDIDSLITSSLNVHLNLGQNFVINTSQTFSTLETMSIEALKSKLIEQPGNARFEIPSNFTLNIAENSSVVLRVRSFTIVFIILLFFIPFSPIWNHWPPVVVAKFNQIRIFLDLFHFPFRIRMEIKFPLTTIQYD